MIIGIGVDLVEVGRVRKIYEKFGEKFLNKIGIKEKKMFPEEIAGIFALKEAGYKALRPIKEFFNPKEIEIVKRKGGANLILYKGKLKKRWEKLGKPKAFVSLSHERGLAIAFVLLYKEIKS